MADHTEAPQEVNEMAILETCAGNDDVEMQRMDDVAAEEVGHDSPESLPDQVRNCGFQGVPAPYVSKCHKTSHNSATHDIVMTLCRLLQCIMSRML